MNTNNSRSLELKQVSKTFQLENSEVQALKNITIDIKKSEFISIVGASGCGKSTLLKMIIGLEEVTGGEIIINEGEAVSSKDIQIGMAFQEARLFPWLSVEKNIEFGITSNHNKDERKKLINDMIALVGLNGFEKALPKQLSGGMQQRVSIARALVDSPDILLLDEPFGALDALTRINMQTEILNVWEKEKKTMILVTHDIDEAIYLSDRIIVLSSRPGEIKDIITVDTARPRDRSSIEFIKIRQRIYKEFFKNSNVEIEYFI